MQDEKSSKRKDRDGGDKKRLPHFVYRYIQMLPTSTLAALQKRSSSQIKINDINQLDLFSSLLARTNTLLNIMLLRP